MTGEAPGRQSVSTAGTRTGHRRPLARLGGRVAGRRALAAVGGSGEAARLILDKFGAA
jgi:hypothetical protein